MARTDEEVEGLLKDSKNQGDYDYGKNAEVMGRRGYTKNPNFQAGKTNAFIKNEGAAPGTQTPEGTQTPGTQTPGTQTPGGAEGAQPEGAPNTQQSATPGEAATGSANVPQAKFGGKSANEVWQAAIAKNPGIVNNPKWMAWAQKYGIPLNTGGTAQSPAGGGAAHQPYSAAGYGGGAVNGSYTGRGGGRGYDDYAYTNMNRPGASAAPKNAADAENMQFDNRQAALMAAHGADALKYAKGNHYRDAEGKDYIYDSKTNSWNEAQNKPSMAIGKDFNPNYERKQHEFESGTGEFDAQKFSAQAQASQQQVDSLKKQLFQVTSVNGQEDKEKAAQIEQQLKKAQADAAKYSDIDAAKKSFQQHQTNEDARYAEHKAMKEAYDQQRDYDSQIKNAQNTGPKNHKTQRFLNGAGNAAKDFWFGRGDYGNYASDKRIKVYKPTKAMLIGTRPGYY